MYETVLAVVRKHKVIWEASLPLKNEILKFETLLAQITQKNEEQTSSKSSSGEKKQLYDQLLDATLMVCSAGLAYANQEKNNGLKARFSYTKSSLKEGNEKDFCALCVQIGKAAEPIQAQLLAYNLAADHLMLLAKMALEFEQLIAGPQKIRTSSKNARIDMIALFDECDALLNDRLDNMLLLYKASHPEFYGEYNTARFIGGWSQKKHEKSQSAI